jgi:hypothetical protein
VDQIPALCPSNLVPKGVHQLEIKCTIKALLALSLVQTSPSMCVMLGGCVVQLEVILLVVGIDPMSCEYKLNLVVDSSSHKKKCVHHFCPTNYITVTSSYIQTYS